MIAKINKLIQQKFQQLQALRDDESGQGIAEYGGVLAAASVLIVVLVIFVNGGMKNDISNEFGNAQQATRNMVKSSTTALTAGGATHLNSAAGL